MTEVEEVKLSNVENQLNLRRFFENFIGESILFEMF